MILSHIAYPAGKSNSTVRFLNACPPLWLFRFAISIAQTEIVGVQKLVRFSFPVLEFAYAGQTDRSKHGANRLHLGMLPPDRLGYHLHEMLAQSVVRSAADLIKQASYT